LTTKLYRIWIFTKIYLKQYKICSLDISVYVYELNFIHFYHNEKKIIVIEIKLYALIIKLFFFWQWHNQALLKQHMCYSIYFYLFFILCFIYEIEKIIINPRNLRKTINLMSTPHNHGHNIISLPHYHNWRSYETITKCSNFLK
jgi:hypothetical protein